MKRNKAWRRWKDWCIQKKRFTLMKNLDSDVKWIKSLSEEKHRMSKRHPLDCGCSHCYLCHSEKLLGHINPHDIKRSRVNIEDEYRIVSNFELEQEFLET